MTRRAYVEVLDKTLRPQGFQRDGSDWIRVRGDMREWVNLQGSWLGGLTVNVSMQDLETDRILRSIPSDPPLLSSVITVRIGQLIDGLDKWWPTDDPNGPSELAEALMVYGLPWFDAVRTLEDQASRWYGRGSPKSWNGALIPLAITLYRMGELHEACALLQVPPPKTAIPALIARAANVRRWLERESGQ